MARKAFGPQRVMSMMVKARNIALSILDHAYPCTPETWARYGIADNDAMQVAVHWAMEVLEHPPARTRRETR